MLLLRNKTEIWPHDRDSWANVRRVLDTPNSQDIRGSSAGVVGGFAAGPARSDFELTQCGLVPKNQLMLLKLSMLNSAVSVTSSAAAVGGVSGRSGFCASWI
ncbi:hypothetical protein BASA83_005450 [Batrachochytrium salamandrivorans]|nr:hypothetical protein BASA83_005450 [Batrachochytrium salamandrivorans]